MTINTPDAVPASLARLDQYLTQALILAADLRVLCVGIFHREAGAIFTVLAEVRRRTGQGASVANLDDGLGVRGKAGAQQSENEQGFFHGKSLRRLQGITVLALQILW